MKQIEVKLAKKGTTMAEFQSERTEAISEMFDNPDENGIYPTTKFFVRLDEALRKALKKQREESLESLLANIKTGWNLSRTKRIKPTGYCGWNLTTYESDDVTILTDIYAKSLDELKKLAKFYLKKT